MADQVGTPQAEASRIVRLLGVLQNARAVVAKRENSSTQTALELVDSIDIYKHHLEKLHAYLVEKSARPGFVLSPVIVEGKERDVAAVLHEDHVKLMETLGLLTDFSNGKGNPLTQPNYKDNFQRRKVDVDERRERLFEVMIGEKFTSNEALPELKACSQVARTFWENNFGKKLESVGIDAFASKYLKYLETVNSNWSRHYRLSQDVFRNMVASVVGEWKKTSFDSDEC
eukprot:TRINITY_DN994_c0_g1_i1.p1 TRINITY_DN994_c0_g1~~TRINITY_DN994_c0_g1_i1.p1  ORF type:complete len:229 (-),score=55.67 TRINITY_DN994_c0_g1_i1:873-1559(-)